MKSFKYIALIFAVVFLTACETIPPRVNTQYIVVSPTEDLIAACPVAIPPNKEEYLAATVAKREEMLYNHSMDHYKNIKQCNIQLEKLRKWKKEQLAVYKEKTD